MFGKPAMMTAKDPELVTYRCSILAEIDESIEVLHRQREDLVDTAFNTLDFKISRLHAEREWLSRYAS